MLKFMPSKNVFLNFFLKRLETVDLNLNDIKPILENTLDITYKRFKTIDNKYYQDGEDVILNTAHSSQMVLFLYELSRQAYLKSFFCQSQSIDDFLYKSNSFLPLHRLVFSKILKLLLSKFNVISLGLKV